MITSQQDERLKGLRGRGEIIAQCGMKSGWIGNDITSHRCTSHLEVSDGRDSGSRMSWWIAVVYVVSGDKSRGPFLPRGVGKDHGARSWSAKSCF